MTTSPDNSGLSATANSDSESDSKASKQRTRIGLAANIQELHGRLVIGQIETIRDEIRTFGLERHRPVAGPRIVYTEPRRPDEMPVFICGLHRSGTSLIEHYLSAHFNVDSLRAKGVPENEGQFLQDVYPHEWPYGGPGAFAFASQMRPMAIESDQQAEHARRRLLGCWESWRAGEGGRLLEKSPPNITKIRYLRSIFPGARFIVWTRDPRAVSMATQKWARCDMDQLMLHWHTAHMAAIDDLQADCAWLSYEHFCQDPQASIERIGAELGLERRPKPGRIGPRFSRVVNSNQKYLEAFPGAKIRLRFAAWDFFGYSTNANA